MTGDPNPVECEPDLPGDIYLSAEMSGEDQAALLELAGWPGARGDGRSPARPRPTTRMEPTDVEDDLTETAAGGRPAADDGADRTSRKQLRRRRRADRRLPRGAARRGARPARRERRRQVDADGRRLRRPSSPDGGDDRASTASSTLGGPRPGGHAGARHRHRPPAPRGAARHDRGGEHPARRAARAPASADGDDAADAMRAMLDDVGFTAHLEDAGRPSLSVAQQHLLELAKALRGARRAADPRRAHRAARPRIRRPALRASSATSPRQGTAVVYITHRLAEVRELADRVTVLRDGRLRGTPPVDDVTDDRAARADRRAPARRRPSRRSTPAQPRRAAVLAVDGLGGDGFSDVSFAARRGEIVGIAGVVGNGQSELLRALAGLDGVRRHGPRRRRRPVPDQRSCGRASGLHAGGPAPRGPDDDACRCGRTPPLVGARPAHTAAPSSAAAASSSSSSRELRQLDVKAPSMEAPVAALSGGNQQKVVMARALLSRAGDPARRRAHPGRRRRRPRRDLPHPAGGRRPRRAGGRRLLATPRSSRACATASRDVARARRRDLDGRRRHRGADRSAPR